MKILLICGEDNKRYEEFIRDRIDVDVDGIYRVEDFRKYISKNSCDRVILQHEDGMSELYRKALQEFIELINKNNKEVIYLIKDSESKDVFDMYYDESEYVIKYNYCIVKVGAKGISASMWRTILQSEISEINSLINTDKENYVEDIQEDKPKEKKKGFISKLIKRVNVNKRENTENKEEAKDRVDEKAEDRAEEKAEDKVDIAEDKVENADSKNVADTSVSETDNTEINAEDTDINNISAEEVCQNSIDSEVDSLDDIEYSEEVSKIYDESYEEDKANIDDKADIKDKADVDGENKEPINYFNDIDYEDTTDEKEDNSSMKYNEEKEENEIEKENAETDLYKLEKQRNEFSIQYDESENVNESTPESKIFGVYDTEELDNISDSDSKVALKDINDSVNELCKVNNLIMFVGTRNSGCTTTVYNVAKIIASRKKLVAYIDFDVYMHGGSYITKNNYEMINLLPRSSSSLNYLVENPDDCYEYANVIYNNIHYFGIGILGEPSEFFKNIGIDYWYKLISRLSNKYDIIIADVPFMQVNGFAKGLAGTADKIYVNVEWSTKSFMEFMMYMGNIQDENDKSEIFNRAKLIINKYNEKESVFGCNKPKLKSGKFNVGIKLDDIISELLTSKGEEYDFEFKTVLPIYAVKYNSNTVNTLFGKKEDNSISNYIGLVAKL